MHSKAAGAQSKPKYIELRLIPRPAMPVKAIGLVLPTKGRSLAQVQGLISQRLKNLYAP